MMKIRNIIISILLSTAIFAQKAAQIRSMADESRDSLFYATQSELWQKETKKDKKNVNAWFNYYRTERYLNFYNRSNFSEKGKNILEDMKKNAGETYEYFYLMYLQEGNNVEYGDYLLKAYKMSPERTLIYPSLASYADITGNNELKKEILQKWYKSGDYQAWKYYKTYNSLIGLDKNAIIFTNGDNDVYGKMLLQENKNIRTDIRQIALPYLFIDLYYKRLLKELNIEVVIEDIQAFSKKHKDLEGQKIWDAYQISRINYIVKNLKETSLYFDNGIQSFLHENYKDSLYLEGIVYKYSTDEYNNLAVMQNNFENNYLLDYVRIDFTNADKYAAKMNSTGSYLAFLTELYDSYKLSGDLNNQKKVEELLMIVGENIGMKDELIEYLEEK